MTRLPFSKWEAVGNDFVVVDDADVVSCGDLSALSRHLCDRHRGVGADGLLVARVESSDRMIFRIFNADGSEDTMCGNGLRCVVADAYSRGLVEVAGVVSTASGRVDWAIRTDGLVSLVLPPPSFEPHRIPTTAPRTDCLPIEGLAVHVVETGSPHAVVFVPQLPDDDVFFSISPRIENHHWFPERVSVMWVTVRSGRQLQLRIWERGVGETRGCGTGACAAVAVARVRGLLREQHLDVDSAGGRLEVEWAGPGEPIVLAGGARRVFRGECSVDTGESF
jgi:diaminopimelate epimerase